MYTVNFSVDGLEDSDFVCWESEEKSVFVHATVSNCRRPETAISVLTRKKCACLILLQGTYDSSQLLEIALSSNIPAIRIAEDQLDTVLQ